MKVSIRPLEKKLSLILPLAEAYERSYRKLSEGYKSEAEMALYKRGYFLKKLWKIAEDTQSIAAVLLLDGTPRGFVRYSKVPAYYTQAVNNQAAEMESGQLDGYEFAWCRKVHFDRGVCLNDRTLIVNQIYLDPQIQRCGLGTFLLENTIPALRQQGFDNLIIEYNANNKNAEKFYQTMGVAAFARTQDFDHILRNSSGRTVFCISDVKIAHTTIDHALERIEERRRLKQTVITAFTPGPCYGKTY